MPNERELQVGDWVRIMQGCGDYAITVPGSVGVVVIDDIRYAEVEFKEYGAGSDRTFIADGTHTFRVNTCHLEKIDPPAHLGETTRTNYMLYTDLTATIQTRVSAPPKTQEQIHEILSQKIDSEEKLLECMVEIRLSKNLFGTDWWKARDNIRTNHEYFKRVTLPGGGCEIAPQDAYLHVSKCKTKVAFYENEDKQKRDICTVMGYGRYLTKYHPELDNEQVKKAVDGFNYDHGVAPEVFFGESEDDFINAINHGPSESCMQGLDFAGHIHPAAVYAAGDIKVAWLERDGAITARTLINKTAKAFSRVYGDHAKLKPLLESMGYESQVGALAGCRLLMIDNENGSGYIMPYVDAGVGTGGGALRFYEAGSYFMLSDGRGTSTAVGNDNDGVTEPQGSEYACDTCGDACDEGDLTYTYHDTSVCPHCLGRNFEYALVSREQHEYVHDNRCTWVHCMDTWVHEDYIGNLDVVMDDFSCEYIELDDAVQTASEQWALVSDCVDCGTYKDGNTIWLHETEVSSAGAGELFKDAEDSLFWHESIEVTEWMAATGSEDFDPEAYVPVEVKKVVKEVQSVTPEPQKSWQDAYLRMQERGIKFLCGGVDTGWSFVGDREGYKIDPTQTPPDDWREIYKEAQASGVVFEVYRQNEYTWGASYISESYRMNFGEPFTSYRLKETT